MKKQTIKKEEVKEEMAAELEPPPDAFDAMSLLIGPMTESSFIERFYEQAPLFLKATEERKFFSEGIFDLEELCLVALEREEDEEDDEEEEDEGEDDEEEDAGPLLFSHDLTARKYVDGEVVLYDEDEFATEVTLRSLYNQGYTFQVHQPQRFSDDLWLLVSALENKFQCLVGVNCYITPPKAQGLAPHHDDVELFIIQTQGSKTWKIYEPINGFPLPNEPSLDLDEDEIGEPVMEVTLNVGDMLYLPRGYIHQAVSSEEGSAHVTISSFQRWSFADLASSSLSFGLTSQQEDGTALPITLRESLPWGFLSKVGLLADLNKGPNNVNPEKQAVAARLAQGLRDLADEIEADEHNSLLSAASDAFLSDFAKNRICPHPDLLPDMGEAPSSLDDYIIGRGEGLFALVPCDGPEDPDVPEGFVKLVNPLMNSRAFHMLPNPNDLDDEDDEDEEGEDSEEDHVHGPDCAHHHHHGEEEESEEEEDDEGEDEGEDEEDEDDDDMEDETGIPGPIIPAAYAPLVSKILSTCEAPGLQLRSLVALAPHKDEQEVLRLAFTLWDDGFISTLPPLVAAPPVKKGPAKKKESASAPVKVEAKKEKAPAKRGAAAVPEGKPAAKKAKK